jgi:hypothetical protein
MPGSDWGFPNESTGGKKPSLHLAVLSFQKEYGPLFWSLLVAGGGLDVAVSRFLFWPNSGRHSIEGISLDPVLRALEKGLLFVAWR